jgi:uncharacterized protein (TIGR00661 family)
VLHQNKDKIGNGLHILVVPLDWGLGHATRCIPIIYSLIQCGATVFLAGENNIETLYSQEFPNLSFLPLKGYRIKYSKSKNSFLLKLLSQLPYIKRTLQHEHLWLQNVVNTHKIDAVISDNRPGLYHATIPTVYITHQLYIETGRKWLNRMAQQVHYHFINRFNQCWVPDTPGKTNLAGKLSHTNILPKVPVKYLGVLSRFKKSSLPVIHDIMVVLSGPEPQRSIFEKILLRQLGQYKGSVVFVQGLPSGSTLVSNNKNLAIYPHLPAEKMAAQIQQSVIVLARAGYSTVMDLYILGQKAILVPTPGQAEQEYLATYLKEKELFYTCDQDRFILEVALEEANKFYKKSIISPDSMDETVIETWLSELKKTTV